MAHHSKEHSCSSEEVSSIRQTFAQMEFERGIWFAAQQDYINRVKYLLTKGALVDRVDSAGYTALHYAARNGHYWVCKLLLDNGAYVNAKTRAGNATALHRAATQGHIRIIEYLLECGAKTNMKDADGYTALHRAIIADSISVCRILVPLTDLEITDKLGRTPLQLATEKGNEKIVSLIEEHQ